MLSTESKNCYPTIVSKRKVIGNILKKMHLGGGVHYFYPVYFYVTGMSAFNLYIFLNLSNKWFEYCPIWVPATKGIYRQKIILTYLGKNPALWFAINIHTGQWLN
jgi:hypothetical protein